MKTKYAVFSTLTAVVIAAAMGAWIVTSSREPANRVSVAYPEGAGAVVPLGDPAGLPPPLSVDIQNPLSADRSAIQNGRQLFTQMNCAGCHGYTAKGGMGPNLTDTAWRYGGRAIDIYKSIYEGRPQGMPAWGTALPPAPIWQLVAYIQSLGSDSAMSGKTDGQSGGADRGASGNKP
jgi:cytochrome c oxidase cbb3-type subunit 3